MRWYQPRKNRQLSHAFEDWSTWPIEAHIGSIVLPGFLMFCPHVNAMVPSLQDAVAAAHRLASVGAGVGGGGDPRSATGKASLLRALRNGKIKGVRRVVAGAECAMGYRDIYALLQAGSIQGSYTQLWQMVK